MWCCVESASLWVPYMLTGRISPPDEKDSFVWALSFYRKVCLFIMCFAGNTCAFVVFCWSCEEHMSSRHRHICWKRCAKDLEKKKIV